LRVFFASWPDAEARDAIAARARDLERQSRGRAPAPENLHLTLAFVGDVVPKRVQALQDVGAVVARSVEASVLVLDRLGAFRAAEIAWLGASAVPAELGRLALDLSEALAAAGFPTEPRPFLPHITLLRRCARPPAAAAVAAVEWRVDRMTLTASVPGRTMPAYRDLAVWPLVASR
jgi:2'-5' RNA ligase